MPQQEAVRPARAEGLDSGISVVVFLGHGEFGGAFQVVPEALLFTSRPFEGIGRCSYTKWRFVLRSFVHQTPDNRFEATSQFGRDRDLKKR